MASWATTTLMGTIREDASEKVFYIGVEDVNAKLAQVVEEGGNGKWQNKNSIR
jgi:hypothetical protein